MVFLERPFSEGSCSRGMTHLSGFASARFAFATRFRAFRFGVAFVVRFGQGGFAPYVIEKQILHRIVTRKLRRNTTGDFGVFCDECFFGGITQCAFVAHVLNEVVDVSLCASIRDQTDKCRGFAVERFCLSAHDARASRPPT